MEINCLGVSHHTASVALREKMSFSSQETRAALARLGCGNGSAPKGINELVILSTCNRVELYSVSTAPVFDELVKFLHDTRGVSPDELEKSFYRLSNQQAVSHLLRVACGLDSLILGEPQILGQVTQALSLSRSQGTVGKVLSRLFQTAIHAGKRARTETLISHNPASISSVAVKWINQHVPDLSQAKTTILGAGEMAELAVEALMKRGAVQVCVVNRTLERAHALARRWNGVAGTFEGLTDILATTDILITSTGAPHTLVSAAMIHPVMANRPGRPLVIMDIAVPRDVEKEVGSVPGVSLFDIDMLSSQLEESLAKREDEVPRVEEIMQEELSGFMEFWASLDVIPLIIGLRKNARKIIEEELEKTFCHVPELACVDQKHLVALTNSIVKKIFHTPTVRLKEAACGPDAVEYVNVTRGLFGLDREVNGS